MSAEIRDGSGRDHRGRFVAGASGNPKGRPSTPREVLDFIGAHTLEAAQKLVSIMRGNDPQQARLAAEALLDRRLGKPAQSVDVTAHRGADAGAPGGNPDQARARLEALIAASAVTGEGVTVGQTVALRLDDPEKASNGALIEVDAAPADAERGQDVANPPPDGGDR